MVPAARGKAVAGARVRQMSPVHGFVSPQVQTVKLHVVAFDPGHSGNWTELLLTAPLMFEC